MYIPEEEDEDTYIIGVDQNTKDPGVNHTTGANNAIYGNPTGRILTNNKNMPKVETVDNKSNTEATPDQADIPGETIPYQEEITGVATLEEEE